MKSWLYHVLVALDQLANAVLLGAADETLSARAWRAYVQRKPFGLIFRPLIDTAALVLTLGWDKHHCRTAYESELKRKHLPSIYQT